MRILQVSPAFPPSAFGGISTHAGMISRGLAARGHDVRVVTTNRYDFRRAMSFWGEREVDGIPVFYARSHWPRRYFFAPSIVQKMKEWFPSVDIIHVHDPRTFVGLAASVAARGLPIPYVVTCHGSISTKIGQSSLKRLYDGIVGKGLILSASKVIALTETERQDLIEFGVASNRIAIVPNTIVASHSRAGEGSAVKDERVGRERREKIILYLGRIHTIKGIDRLIEAFSRGLAHSQDSRLVIVGQDYGAQRGLERQVRRLGIGDRVDFPGPIYGAVKDRLLATADVLVLPSYAETFPLVVLEAFVAGVPVVVTTACGIADELERSRAALVASSTDQLASDIERCLYDHKAAEALRRNGLHLVQTKYSPESVLGELENIYEEAIAGGPSDLRKSPRMMVRGPNR